MGSTTYVSTGPPLTPKRRPSPGVEGGRVPSIVRSIGSTPLFDLTGMGRDLAPDVFVFAKGEHLNPGGSVKDRAAWAMIREGLGNGDLKGRTLIDATSGNTGIAYAMLGAALDISVVLALPANASEPRKQALLSYGAEVLATDPVEGTDGARLVVQQIVDRNPDRYFYPDQYNNDANWRAHFDGTGREILDQTAASITHFVAALGTTGTFTGVSRRLKRHNESVECIPVQPDSPLHDMEGVKHMATAVIPGIYDDSLSDREVVVSTDEAYEMTRRLAREEGLLVGVSSGANVAAAFRVARELDEGVVVTILCDTGTRYGGQKFWTDARSA